MVVFEDEPGSTRIIWLFSLVLGQSRFLFARFVLHQDLQTLLRCHMAAFEAIGGVPVEILARHGLHASTLDIRHPTTSAEQRFEAPLAADIRAVLIALRSATRLLKTVDRHAGRWG